MFANREESTPLEPSSVAGLEASWVRWSWGFVGLGIFLRLVAYAFNFPLWWDEAFVAVNLLRRDYSDLLRPLDYGQVCPLLFLWAELFAVKILGFHEWSLRLFPLACSIGGLILFRGVAKRLLEGKAVLLSVGILAVSVHPIRHAADLKPYAADLLVALALVGLALEWTKHPERVRWLLALTAFGPLGLLLSHPAIFVVGGIALSLAWKVVETRRFGVWLAWLAYGASVSLAYVAIYLLFVKPQATSASPGMAAMWTRSFPPLDSIFSFGRWLMVAHSGDLMAYPCGGEQGGSIASLILGSIGAIVLFRCRQGQALAILIGPLGLAIVAAGLRLYPYGGPAPHGSAARIMQYAAPSLCLLIGIGTARVIDLFARPSLRRRLVRLACLALVGVGVIPQVTSFLRPYRAYQAESARRFAEEFWPKIGRDAEVACLRWDLGVADWDSIKLGVAVFLCNEAIQTGGRDHPGPRLEKVSPNHPLRCVLGVAPDVDTSRVQAWLERMRLSYDLRSRESIRVPIVEPGRSMEYERYEVFEFVPKDRLEPSMSRVAQSVKGR